MCTRLFNPTSYTIVTYHVHRFELLSNLHAMDPGLSHVNQDYSATPMDKPLLDNMSLATNVTGKRQSNSVKWHNKFAVPKWGRVIRHQLCSLRRRVDIAMNNHDSLDSFWENIFFHQWTRHEGLICFVSLLWMKGFFRTVITLPLIILQTLGGNKNWIYVFALTFR